MPYDNDYVEKNEASYFEELKCSEKWTGVKSKEQNYNSYEGHYLNDKKDGFGYLN